MIELNKKSWHYSMVSRYLSPHREIETNLCPYVRQVIQTLIMFTFAALAVIVVLAVWLGAMAAGLSMMTSPEYTESWVLMAVSTILFSITWGIPTGVLLLFTHVKLVERSTRYSALMDRLEARWDARRERKRQALIAQGYTNMGKKGPGIVRLYFRALHDKVCPSINFKDDNES